MFKIFVFGWFFGGILFGDFGEKLVWVFFCGVVGVCGGEGGMKWLDGDIGGFYMIIDVFWF